MTTEWNEATDIRSLLVSVLNRESRYFKKGRANVSDCEVAIETSLARSGWTSQDVNYIIGAGKEGELDELKKTSESSAKEIKELRDHLREVRSDEVKAIKSMIEAYQERQTAVFNKQGTKQGTTKFMNVDDSSKIQIDGNDQKAIKRMGPLNSEHRFDWEKYTGNHNTKPSSKDLGFTINDNKGVHPSFIYGLHKPKAWKTIDHELSEGERAINLKMNASMGISAEEDEELTNSMSITEFLKGIPAFHKATNDDLAFFEENGYSRRYEAGLQDEQIICDSDDVEDVFIIRNGVVDQSTPTVINEHGEASSLFPLTRGAIFPVQQKDDGYVVYKPVGIVDLICINTGILSERENLQELIRDLISISVGASPDQISLSKHVEHHVQFRELLTGKKKDEFDRRFDDLEGRRDDSDFNINSLVKVDHNEKDEPVFIKTRSSVRRSILQVAFEYNDSDGNDNNKTNFLSPLDRKRARRVSNASLGMGQVVNLSLAKTALLMEMWSVYSPELNFDDTVRHIIRMSKDFFGIDSVGLFEVDLEKGTMTLRLSQISGDVEIPLQGIAGFVARTGTICNIPDVYNDRRFNPAMDFRTVYRTKRMLALPVFHDKEDRVIAVLQFINPYDGRVFSEVDEALAQTLCEELGQLFSDYKTRLNLRMSIPIYEHVTPVRFKLCHVLYSKAHNHLKCQIQIFHGPNQYGKTKTTMVYPSELLSDEYLSFVRQRDLSDGNKDERLKFSETKKCIFDLWIDFHDIGLNYCDLPHSTRIVLSFTSKNNQYTGWAGFLLFDSKQTLKTGRHQLYLNPGKCNNPTLPLMEFERVAMNVTDSVTIELPVFETSVYYESKMRRTSSLNVSGPLLNVKKGAASEFEMNALAYLRAGMAPHVQERFDLITSDPIIPLQGYDKALLWNTRDALSAHPKLLPKFLLSVDWFDPSCVSEAYNLMHTWEMPSYMEALQLLDSRFPDPKVRAFAVQILGGLTDTEMIELMLQMVQLAKNETHHDNALTRFMLRRAITNPHTVGHAFFWLLRADFYSKVVTKRFEILLDVFMHHLGHSRIALGQQVLMCQQLEEVIYGLKPIESIEQKNQLLREKLSELKFPSTFRLPLSSTLEFSGVDVSKCMPIKSKKPNETFQAVMLTFENADPLQPESLYKVIYKVGEDVRQNQLTLKILAVMNSIWLKENLDLHMTCYSCMATGSKAGIIEMVEGATTVSNIIQQMSEYITAPSERDHMIEKWLMLNNIDHLSSQKDIPTVDDRGNWRPERRNSLSGPSSITASSVNGKAQKRTLEVGDHVIFCDSNGVDHECVITEEINDDRYLLEDHHGSEIEAHRDEIGIHEEENLGADRYVPSSGGMDLAREKFMKSLAAYTVATFVIGIGDRNNENVMLKKSGELFHVDYETFGSSKSIFGVKKASSSCYFIPAFSEVLGGVSSPLYNRFLDTCTQAFNTLRKNSTFLITMFSLMVGSGISELSVMEDIDYLRDNLMLPFTEEEAADNLKKIIEASRTKGKFYL